MDSKSLMIDDWVSVNGNPIQVEEIVSGGINPEYICGEIDSIVYEFEPIPLTEEVLKANGFYKDGSIIDKDGSVCRSYSLDNNDDIWCYIDKNGVDLRLNTDMNKGIIIHYVHELQHALRLCRLNELADNFKIKAMEGKV